MDSISSLVHTLADGADEKGHNEILLALRDLQYSLEKPLDTFLRFYNSHFEGAIIHVGAELGLFSQLAKGDATLTTQGLAEKSGASADLLERILRYLAAVGYIDNVGPNEFRPNKITHLLAGPMAAAGIHHIFDTCGPAIQAIPSFLAETNYRDITSNEKTPFQKGHGTDLTMFQWLPQHPKFFDAMQQAMTAAQSNDWTDKFDLLDSAVRSAPVSPGGKTFLVDVGGGHGHQCLQLRDKYPNLHGRLILQDLPQAIDQLPPIDGVKTMAQDFFEKQAVSGASFYYLRRILHDWPDALCVKILQNLAAAMDTESRILIDEIVLPDVDVHWHAAMADLSMGILLGGKERSRKQWQALVIQSGLRLAQIHSSSVSQHSSVLVLVMS